MVLILNPKVLDAFTVFDTMEHWHNSPKRTFHQLMTALKPGGLFIVSAPNCVNLRKRITVPFGVGKWTAMRDWYEVEQFRSHVREPDVADLRYIAADLGLKNAQVIGRNWSGYRSRFRAARNHYSADRPGVAASAITLLGHLFGGS